MSKFSSNEKDNILSTFVELHFMLFHEYECSMNGTIGCVSYCIYNIYLLKGVDPLANYYLSTSSDKFEQQ